MSRNAHTEPPRLLTSVTQLTTRLPASVLSRIDAGAVRAFPVRITTHVLDQVAEAPERAEALLGQYLPVASELETVAGFDEDPVGDHAARRHPGLLHKYQGRVLLVVTGSCAVHCRYCFRRHFPYEEAGLDWASLRGALALIEEDDSISEVILSGGDPLMLSARRWRRLIEAIDAIAHVRRLRIHTRIPTVMPDQLSEAHLGALRDSPLQVVLVAHVNHPDELDARSAAVFRRCRDAGVTLLNQTVLLAGVNDRAEVLRRLSERLFDQGVLPYYLHQLDKVAGAAHFHVPESVGLDLMAALRAALPGYLVPRYVRERPGAPSKEPVEGGATP